MARRRESKGKHMGKPDARKASRHAPHRLPSKVQERKQKPGEVIAPSASLSLCLASACAGGKKDLARQAPQAPGQKRATKDLARQALQTFCVQERRQKPGCCCVLATARAVGKRGLARQAPLVPGQAGAAQVALLGTR